MGQRINLCQCKTQFTIPSVHNTPAILTSILLCNVVIFGVCSMEVPTWWLQGRVCFSGASCSIHRSFDGKECHIRTMLHICTGCFIGCDLIWFNISEDAKGTRNLFLFGFTGRQDTRTLEMHWTVVVNSYPPTSPAKMTLAKGRTQTSP